MADPQRGRPGPAPGFEHTDETKAKLSALHTGKNNPFYGKTHTAETRARLSAHTRIRNQSRTYEPAPQRVVIPGELQLAYLAGMVDADGSVGFKTDNSTKQKVLRPYVTVYNTSVLLMDWLMKTFQHGSISKANMGREQVHQWSLGGSRDIYVLLIAIRPWMVIKAERADKVIDFIGERYQWKR